MFGKILSSTVNICAYKFGVYSFLYVIKYIIVNDYLCHLCGVILTLKSNGCDTSNNDNGGAQENVDGENGKKEQRDDEYGMSNLDEGEGDEGENDMSQYADDVRILLLQGAENQCTDDVKRAIESGVDINCVNTMEESALIITMKQNSLFRRKKLH